MTGKGHGMSTSIFLVEEKTWRGSVPRVLEIGYSIAVLKPNGHLTAAWTSSDILSLTSDGGQRLRIVVPGLCGIWPATRVFELKAPANLDCVTDSLKRLGQPHIHLGAKRPARTRRLFRRCRESCRRLACWRGPSKQ
jgi:hypothetical protein